MMFPLFCIISLITQIDANETFVDAVQTLLDEFEQEYHNFNSVADDAKKTMENRKFVDWDVGKKWAGVMANIYTSPVTVTGLTNGTIHNILNQELIKSQRPDMWTRFKDVMILALDLLGKQRFSEVFRGERINYTNKLHVHVIHSEGTRRFYSTTLDPTETRTFGGGNGILYRILNVVGTDIHEVSVLPVEREVLIQPGVHFKVIKYVCGIRDIKNEMANIKLKYKDFPDDTFVPYRYIVLKQTQN